jgi:iron complex transport system substrate-binding protein
MKICSFLPSGTEILFALGLGDSVRGVTFECDYPAEARKKPVVVYSKLLPHLPEAEIDRQVKASSQAGQSLYRLDVEKLERIQPDLIVTQDLCHVCAASPDDLGAVLGLLSPQPEVLALSPRTIADVWSDILKVGGATGRKEEAKQLVSRLTAHISEPTQIQKAEQPRVLCLEWLDPPFVAGHWVPEMVELAGGIDVLGVPGEPGYEVSWQTVVRSDPDLIFAMPCGYHAPEVEKELREVHFPREWYSLRAVQSRSVFAMDASSHFSRPGPRIAEGVVELRRLLDRATQVRAKATSAKVVSVALNSQVKENR